MVGIWWGIVIEEWEGLYWFERSACVWYPARSIRFFIGLSK